MKLSTLAAALAAAALTAVLLFGAAAPAHAIDSAFAVEADVTHDGAAQYDLVPRIVDITDGLYDDVTLTQSPIVIDGQIDLTEALLALLSLAATGLAAWVGAALRGFLAGKVEQGMADLLVRGTESAINYGINATKDAVRDRPLSIEVGSEVLERALEYGIRLFPDLIARFGGTEAQRQRIMARLNLEAGARLAAPKPPAETIVATPG